MPDKLLDDDFMPAASQLARFWHNAKVEPVLLKYDLLSSYAHVRMLGETGIVGKDEANKVLAGLAQIDSELASGKEFLQVDDLDIHLGLERRLREIIGDAAEVLRIAKSSNDQIASDIRLWLREETINIASDLATLRQTIINLTQRDLEVIVPGYTHLQPAMPILLSHWWLAHEARFRRDSERAQECYRRINRLPLGAGALAGIHQPIDRNLVATYLGFESVIENSLDAVSDRDYLIEFATFAVLTGTHLSQLAQDLLVWQTHEFGFIRLRKPFALGSLTMPQKRNPELLEVLRARPALFAARLTEIILQLKDLPMGYCQDLQESLSGLLDVVETLKSLLQLANTLLPSIEVDAERMKQAAYADLTNASNAVDFLVTKGVVAEQAGRIVQSLTQYCKERRKYLSDLAINEWQYFSPAFDEDIYRYVTIEESLSSISSFGGTSSAQVAAALSRAKESVAQDMKQIESISLAQKPTLSGSL
jgi:argininosuccinate lyase